MKKGVLVLFAIFLLIQLPVAVFAEEAHELNEPKGFNISIDEILNKIDASEVSEKNGVVEITTTIPINNLVYTEITISLNSCRTTNVKSFSMEGWFRLISTEEIVSVYGLDGSFEYDGTTATSTGYSAYHNSCASGWIGSYNTRANHADNGTASITGDYTLKHNGSVNNTAYCTAYCTKSGSISFSGNYDESTVI